MVMVRRFARDVRVAAVREVNTFNKALFAEELEQAKDGCASDAETPTSGVLHKVCGGEVAVATRNERSELPARASDPHPRAVQCVQHLFCHEATITQMRPSLNSMTWGPVLPVAILPTCS